MLERITGEILDVLKRKRELTKEQEENIEYFLQFLIFNFGVLLIVYTLAAILNILFEVILIHISFFFLKQQSGGIHAKKPINCLLFTCIFFLLVPLIFTRFSIGIPIWIVTIFFLLEIVILAKYAPADTENNPLVYIKQRRRKKIISLVIVGIYFLLSIMFKQFCIYLLYGSLLATLTTLPIIYKIAKQKYRNYEDYVQM